MAKVVKNITTMLKKRDEKNVKRVKTLKRDASRARQNFPLFLVIFFYGRKFWKPFRTLFRYFLWATKLYFWKFREKITFFCSNFFCIFKGSSLQYSISPLIIYKNLIVKTNKFVFNKMLSSCFEKLNDKIKKTSSSGRNVNWKKK